MALKSATNPATPRNRPPLAAGRARVCNAMPSCVASCWAACNAVGRPSKLPAGSIAKRPRPPSATRPSTASSTPRSAAPTTAPGATTCPEPSPNAAGAAAAEAPPPASSKTASPLPCAPMPSSSAAPSDIGKPTSCCSPLPVRPSSSPTSANPASSCWQSNPAKLLNRPPNSSSPGSRRSTGGCAEPSPSTMEPSSLNTTFSPTSSACEPSSATPTVPGKRAPSKTPSAASEDPCPATQTSTPSTTTPSTHASPPTTTRPESASDLGPRLKRSLPNCCTSNVNPHPRYARDDSIFVIDASGLQKAASTLLRPRHRLGAVASQGLRHRGDAALAAGIDLHCRGHAGADRWLADLRQKPKLHRQALHDLDPVSTGVLRRQDGELRAGRRAQAFDHRLPGRVGIGVEHHCGLLADPHIGELGLLEIGLDPGTAHHDQREQRGRCLHLLALLQAQIHHHAVDRGAHRGPRQVERGALARGRLVAHHGMLVGRQLRIAVQRRQNALQLLAHRRHPVGSGARIV